MGNAVKHDGFDSEDLVPLPARGQVGIRQRDERLLTHYRIGLPLREIAERNGLAGAKAAQVAINRALQRLDKRAQASVDIMRARELLELNRIADALEAGADNLDAKTVAELRLLSESRRRLYALDLKRDADAGPEAIIVDVRLPWDRPDEIIDAEAVEVRELEAGEPEDPPA